MFFVCTQNDIICSVLVYSVQWYACHDTSPVKQVQACTFLLSVRKYLCPFYSNLFAFHAITFVRTDQLTMEAALPTSTDRCAMQLSTSDSTPVETQYVCTECGVYVLTWHINHCVWVCVLGSSVMCSCACYGKEIRV